MCVGGADWKVRFEPTDHADEVAEMLLATRRCPAHDQNASQNKSSAALQTRCSMESLARSAVEYLTAGEGRPMKDKAVQGWRAVGNRDPTHSRRCLRGYSGSHSVTGENLA